MFGAVIDIFHDEIDAAIAGGDDRRLAEIARAFCERCHYYKPWKIVGVRAHVCPLDGLQAIVDLEFTDGRPATVRVGQRNGKRRITLDGEDVKCDSSADVVHHLETPCAFFDGIYYAIEGLEDVAKGQLKEQIAKWDAQAKQSRTQCETEFATLCLVEKRLRYIEGQIASAHKRLGEVIEACEIAEPLGSWTIRPVSWCDRIAETRAMLEVPVSDFYSVTNAKQKLSGKSGVYFGWRLSDGKCVYVGKSSNLGSRINPSRSELLDCKITVLEMPEEHIHTWELFFIWLHNPERNIEVRKSVESAQKALPSKNRRREEVAHGR